MTLTNSVSVSEFVGCEDPIRLLTDTTSIVLDLPTDDLFDQHAMTTLEIRECIRDLKVRLLFLKRCRGNENEERTL